VLLHFGLDWHGKGGECFRAAIDELKVVGVIVGRDATAQALRRSGGGEDVRVVAPREDVERFYAAADVLVSPSRSEGMPLAMLEALASGVPVVASDIPGHRFIAGSVSACVLARADGADLATRIREVLGWSAERRRAETEAARAWVVEHADLRAWGAQIRRLYLELVASA
jgi:glycosyltransferase involved in cell wall biosynthesis